jgi:hypothetical protein
MLVVLIFRYNRYILPLRLQAIAMTYRYNYIKVAWPIIVLILREFNEYLSLDRYEARLFRRHETAYVSESFISDHLIKCSV